MGAWVLAEGLQPLLDWCVSHTAAALQTLKTENGHLWSLIEGHASAEGLWAARLQQDGSSLQALEAERRALRQQVRDCPYRYLRLQAACTSCRVTAGMPVGQSVQFIMCAMRSREGLLLRDSSNRTGCSHCRWRPSAGSAATCQSASRMHRSAERPQTLLFGGHLSPVGQVCVLGLMWSIGMRPVGDTPGPGSPNT